MDGIVLDDLTALIITKNDCGNCDATKELFSELETPYVVINMDDQPEYKRKIKELGFKQAPVVITNETRWSGYNEEEIRAFASGESIW